MPLFSTRVHPGKARIGTLQLFLTGVLAALALASVMATGNAMAAAPVEVGDERSCALKKNGTVWCWGSSYYGLGDVNSTTESAVPVRVTGLTGVTDLAVSEDFACAVTAEKGVVCWGDGGDGQLGNGQFDDSATPVPVAMPGNAREISAGKEHICALQEVGTVICWGDNNLGQLGDGSFDDRAAPVPASGITDAVAVAAGSEHSCAVLASGKVKCWGENDYGQLGNGVSGDEEPLPVEVIGGLGDAIGVTAGTDYSCALRAGGSVSCWGENFEGQLGDGTIDDRLIPTEVSGLSGAVAVSAGSFNTCALTGVGELYCWGENEAGQLGTDITAVRSMVPVKIAGPGKVTGLSVGYRHICASGPNRPESTHDVIRCWGDGTQGQLGNGKFGSSATPLPVPGLTGLKSIAAGNYHSCVLTDAGEVACWGSGRYGELGQGSRLPEASPVTVPGVDGVTRIASGNIFTCAVRNDGNQPDRKITCWGDNWAGQLGIGNVMEEYSASPVDTDLSEVLADPNHRIEALTAGDAFTCALARPGGSDSGEIWCWGRSGMGQTGSAVNPPPQEKLPVKVFRQSQPPLLLTADQSAGPTLAAGSNHACAISRYQGQVWCWGANWYGQLGDASVAVPGDIQANNRMRPVRVKDAANNFLEGAVSIAAGEGHTCALLGTGKVMCWGNGTLGQLGRGSNVSSNVAVEAQVDDVKSLSLRGSQTCAVHTDGTLSCWGYRFDEDFPAAGNPGSGNSTPSPVSGATGVESLSLAEYHACFTTTSGTASCWASGTQGYRYAYSAPHGDGSMPSGHFPIQRVPTAVVGFQADPDRPLRPAHPRVELRDGKVQLRGFTLQRTGAKPCGKKVRVNASARVTLRQGGRKVTRTVKTGKSLKLKRNGTACQVTGTVKLKGRLARAKKVTLRLAGNGIKPVKRRLKARWTVAVQGTRIKLDRLPATSTRTDACPATATAIVTGGTRATRKLRKVRRKAPVAMAPGANCQVTVTFKLPRKLARAPKLKVTVKGSGLEPARRTFRSN